MPLNLEGLELQTLVLFGEIIEVELCELVRDVIHMRASPRRCNAVDERNLFEDTDLVA
jgi:hypothetical protein